MFTFPTNNFLQGGGAAPPLANPRSVLLNAGAEGYTTPDSAKLSPTTGLAFSLYTYHTVLPGLFQKKYMCAKWDGGFGQASYLFTFGRDATDYYLLMEVSDDGSTSSGNDALWYLGGAPTLSTWYQWTFSLTVGGTMAAGAKAWVDAVDLGAPDTANGSPASIFDSTSEVILFNSIGKNLAVQGNFAEFRLYDRPLAQPEVTAGFGVNILGTTPGLILYVNPELSVADVSASPATLTPFGTPTISVLTPL